MQSSHTKSARGPNGRRRPGPKRDAAATPGKTKSKRKGTAAQPPSLGNRLVRFFGHGVLGLIALTFLAQLALIVEHDFPAPPEPRAVGSAGPALAQPSAAVLEQLALATTAQVPPLGLGAEVQIQLAKVALFLPMPIEPPAAAQPGPAEQPMLPAVPRPAVLNGPGNLRRAILRHRLNYYPHARQDCTPPALMGVLYDIAEKFGTVKIASTFRSKRHNASVGGASRSMHLECRAVDFFVQGNAKDIVAFIKAHPAVGGFKRYPTGHYHIDNGPRRTW